MRWRWTKVQRANLPQDERDLLERCGSDLIRMMLVSGLHPALPELSATYGSPEKKARAATWLTEKAQQAERREERLETVEVAILVLVGLEVLHDFGPFIKAIPHYFGLG
jgi:hypothetical protein